MVGHQVSGGLAVQLPQWTFQLLPPQKIKKQCALWARENPENQLTQMGFQKYTEPFFGPQFLQTEAIAFLIS